MSRKRPSLNEQQRKKRKGVQLSIHEAEIKKSTVETNIDILGNEADNLAKSAEAKHDIRCTEIKGCPAVTRNPLAGERTQRAKVKAQEHEVNITIYSAALQIAN